MFGKLRKALLYKHFCWDLFEKCFGNQSFYSQIHWLTKDLILVLPINEDFKPDLFLKIIFPSFWIVDLELLILVTLLINLIFIMDEYYTLISMLNSSK